jgi:hypothetical protein
MNRWCSISSQFRGVTPRSRAWGFALLAAGLFLLPAARAAAAASVAVVESPTAAGWLRSAGLECQEITGEQLGASVPDVPLLILPLDRVRSDAALRSLAAFTGRGGKVVAVYWGTIARPEQQSTFPVYATVPLLGLRVVGWVLTGPAFVRPELPAAGAAGYPAAVGGGSAEGAAGSAAAGELRLERAMMIRVEPEPTAQVLARLAPVSGEAPLALAVRNGNVLYVAANLFQGDPPAPELRRLFFWVLDQALPGLVFSRVRERAGAAVAAVIRARARLASFSAPTAEAVRNLLTQADGAAARAKSLAAGERFAESIAASETARELTERATGMMEGH